MLKIYYQNQFTEVQQSSGFDIKLLQDDRPGAHIIRLEDEIITARCSVWWDNAPQGCIGHFFADDVNAAGAVLRGALNQLKQNGCEHALAPMNGNTWREYRYATAGADKPQFLMEPQPALGRDKFLSNAGFSVCDSYYSYDESLANAPEKPPESNIRLRQIDMDKLEQELDLIYELAIAAFRENPYYADISRKDFVQSYLAYGKMLLPELILIAEDGSRTVGFLFCIPDYLQGVQPDTVLLKTIAVLPEYRSCGLGGTLMETAKHRAAVMGFRRCVYALVYEKNISRRFCQGAKLLREYSLFRRAL